MLCQIQQFNQDRCVHPGHVSCRTLLDLSPFYLPKHIWICALVCAQKPGHSKRCGAVDWSTAPRRVPDYCSFFTSKL